MRASTKKRISMRLRADRWFGVPRWLVLAVGVAILIGYGTFGRPGGEADQPVSAEVRTIVEGLRTTSVYEAPDAPGKVDAQRARELLGDRPIVLALLDDEPRETESVGQPNNRLCEQIADLVATSLVIVYAHENDGGYGPDFCVGPQFENAENPVDASNYDFVLISEAELAWKYRVTDDDLFPQIEEYVFAFDAQAAKDYPDGIPRRAVVVPPPPAPDAPQAWQVALSLAGILFGTIALFVCLRLAGRGFARRWARDAATRHRGEAASARLNKLADQVLHPARPGNAADARRQARLAGEYVEVLADFEAADTRAKLAGVDARLTELEKEAAR